MFWSGVVRKSKHNTEENNDSLAEKLPLCTRYLQLPSVSLGGPQKLLKCSRPHQPDRQQQG